MKSGKASSSGKKAKEAVPQPPSSGCHTAATNGAETQPRLRQRRNTSTVNSRRKKNDDADALPITEAVCKDGEQNTGTRSDAPQEPPSKNTDAEADADSDALPQDITATATATDTDTDASPAPGSAVAAVAHPLQENTHTPHSSGNENIVLRLHVPLDAQKTEEQMQQECLAHQRDQWRLASADLPSPSGGSPNGPASSNEHLQAYHAYDQDTFISKPSVFHGYVPPPPLFGITVAVDRPFGGAYNAQDDQWHADHTAATANGRHGHAGADGVSSGGGGLRKHRLLNEFNERCKTGNWPASTNVHCYWCCHRFENTPFGIPLKYVDGRFHVFGCFCSLECAAAYNFAHGSSVDEMWDRYALLNMMEHHLNANAAVGSDARARAEEQPRPQQDKQEHGRNDNRPAPHNRVRQAPDRLALTMFGGFLSIEEFRSYCPSRRFTVVNFPPMMSLTQQVEEINESDVRSTHRFVPLDNERVERYQKKIILQRSKPVVSQRNTLDRAMNIKIDPVDRAAGGDQSAATGGGSVNGRRKQRATGVRAGASA